MNKKTTMTWERLFFVWNQWPLVPSEGPLETAFGKLGPMKNDFRSLEKRQCSTKSDIFCAGAATWLAAWEWSKIHWRLGCWIQSLLLLLGYSFFFPWYVCFGESCRHPGVNADWFFLKCLELPLNGMWQVYAVKAVCFHCSLQALVFFCFFAYLLGELKLGEHNHY